MQSWRQLGSIWQLRPKQPRGLIEFIGGSYLAATPQVSYRRILEDLCNAGLAIHAWAYVPGFDHRFVVIDQAEYDAAMAELELQKNVALIREGISDVEAGRVQPLEEAMDDIRRELGFRPRQTT